MGRRPGLAAVILAVGAFAAGGVALIPTDASASAMSLPPGFQITVTESAPTMVFGETSPTFNIFVTVPPSEVPPPPTPNVLRQVFLLVDGNAVAVVGDVTALTNSFFLNGLPSSPPLAAGVHSVAAMYASPTLGDLTGPAITLTVLKSTPVLQCGMQTPALNFAPGASVTVGMTFSNVNGPVDFQDGTFSLTFSGAHTFTVDGLKADGSGNVVATLPSVPDSYEGMCTFSGTNSVNTVQARLDNGVPIIVSRDQAIGGITLSTDPAMLTSNVTMTWHVTVLPGPGLPAPTGYIHLRLGALLTSIVALAGGGSVTFTTTPTSFNGVTTIEVFYNGDPVYAPSSARFPLDNPAPSPQSVPSVAASTLPAPPMTGAAPEIGARDHTPGPGAIALLALTAFGLALGGLWLRLRAVAIQRKR